MLKEHPLAIAAFPPLGNSPSATVSVVNDHLKAQRELAIHRYAHDFRTNNITDVFDVNAVSYIDCELKTNARTFFSTLLPSNGQASSDQVCTCQNSSVNIQYVDRFEQGHVKQDDNSCGALFAYRVDMSEAES